MEEDCRRALESFFPYGCGRCVFKHNIGGNQLEGLDCTPDSSNSLSLECFAGLRCPLVLNSFEDTADKEHCREVAEEFGKGDPSWGLHEHPPCFFFFFFVMTPM